MSGKDQRGRSRGLREFRMKAGPTTRIVTLETGESVRFARSALDDAAQQVTENFVPLGTEHLSYLPPLGRVYAAEVVEDDEGHADLYFLARELPRGWTQDFLLDKQLPAGELAKDLGEIEVTVEPRNFESAEWAEVVACSPVEVRQGSAWSSLPPLIWLISIPVTWGVAQFMGGFLQHFGQVSAGKLGEWITQSARRARDADRDSLVEVRFETATRLVVTAFIPLAANTGTALDELRSGLDGLGPLAQFAGRLTVEDSESEIQLICFIYDEGSWRLGWWASPDAVYISPWMTQHCPDPRRFLGRPLLEPSTSSREEPRADLPHIADSESAAD
jgi:hypothetical protein